MQYGRAHAPPPLAPRNPSCEPARHRRRRNPRPRRLHAEVISAPLGVLAGNFLVVVPKLHGPPQKRILRPLAPPCRYIAFIKEELLLCFIAIFNIENR